MKRLTIFLISVLCCCTTVSAQLTIDGRTLAYDHRTGTYLCSVPESMFDDGSVKAFKCDTADIRFTFLPIVRLNGEFGYDYANGTVDVIMPSSDDMPDMTAKVKWRGGSTNGSDKHKRNYHIKFIGEDGKKQDRKLFGLRNDNSWLLDAAQVDMSRVRNRVATDIWNDFATKPYYFDKEPKALTGTRGQFVEVFLNDEYRGIYCMTENIDRSQMKLKKYTKDAEGNVTIHGQLWKSKSWTPAGMWNYYDYDNTSDVWGALEMKYPDIEDVCPTDWSTFYDCARFFTDCTFEEFAAHRDEYIDMPVLTDFYILMTLLCAVDNTNGKNIFWACYDKQVDKKLTPAVWDMDCSVGNSFDPKNPRADYMSPENICYDYFWGIKPIFISDSLDINNFRSQREARWKELRKTHFTEENLTKRYVDYMQMLTKTGAYKREKERWDGDSDIDGRKFNFVEEQDYICKWIHRRLQVLDREFPYCPDSIEEIIATPQEMLKTTPYGNATYTILGQRVTNAKAPGLYIKNGKKHIIH